MSLLEVTDLRVSFSTEDGLVRAVDGVSFKVDEGRTLGIVGESGSGKSVANLTLIGLTRAPNAEIEGEAMYGDRDLISMDEDELRRIRGSEIGMIFQDPLSSLHPFYRVGDQLVEAILAHRGAGKHAARERAIELLELVGIPRPRDRMDSWPHEFSGGMRQRVMIAMALVNDPKLLIADEPTTALDVTMQAQILELIARLQSELGMAVILITHDLGVVAENADEIAVMYAGRVVEIGSTRTIFEAPEHPYTWGLLGSIPTLSRPRDEELVPIQGHPPSLIRLPSGCHFHPRCPYVRERHTREDPRIEPVDGEDGHAVACLLSRETRRRLWKELRAGRDSEGARRKIGLETLRDD